MSFHLDVQQVKVTKVAFRKVTSLDSPNFPVLHCQKQIYCSEIIMLVLGYIRYILKNKIFDFIGIYRKKNEILNFRGQNPKISKTDINISIRIRLFIFDVFR